MPLSILVIEDASNWREQLTSILHDEGYAVKTAGNYLEALRLLRHNVFDLVVIDLRLGEPETDRSGMDLLSDAYERQIPTIVVTGYGTRELAEEAFRDYGVYDFIAKDKFDADKFRENIKIAVETSQRRQHPEPLTPEQKVKFEETIRKMFRGETIEF